MSGVSVLTIARGRDAALANVVRGLCRQTVLPDELVIARMQDAPYELPDAPFPIRQIHVSGEELPLSNARNAAARAATRDSLVFLDADCIPAPDLVREYRSGIEAWSGILMGEVMYLPSGALDGGIDYAAFAAASEKHSDRRGPPEDGIDICNDYRCFWSLNFGLSRAAFELIGGFDERYSGYGGEDTDFGKTAVVAGLPIGWLKGGRVYHQYHAHHMPPIHHLHAVVRNALKFEEKWGYRTMGHWLYAFGLMGLLDEDESGALRILREPNDADRALSSQSEGMPYVNTARVIRALQAMKETASPRIAAE
ncbi:galactosyltransferase-related protein [Tropicimonas sp. IMCC34011]|uniref:galactosyltransferase-related protein n=1 Tax=Tropicimonas sp. IMCC34011 TaxID=2248759 RepID=UPI000E257C37|nr:galactosyltransferase-related protein [Tropicimonas sp. IMCC34011]